MARDGCPFCDYEGPSEVRERWKIPHAGQTMRDALRSGEYDEFLIFEPLDPVTPGHVLVVPVEHAADFRESSRLTSHATRVAAEYVAEKGDPADGCNLIVSAGASATQVEHLHVHVVPRREGDGLLLPWSGTLIRFGLDDDVAPGADIGKAGHSSGDGDDAFGIEQQRPPEAC